jgi:AcrR family transcriptional regulator
MAATASSTTLPELRSTAQHDTPSRILDAAFECVGDVGLSRTTVEDVARAAGLARQTIYRYFPSKEHLIMALVLREEEKFLDGVQAAFQRAGTLQEAMEQGMLFCLRYAREHPLLDRLLAKDAETLLPYLTTHAAPFIAHAREAFRALVSTKSPVDPTLLDEAGDLAVRVTLSYALTPPDRAPEEVARDLARILTLALIGREESRT